MKLRINRNILLEHLNNVGRALSNRNIIPIINGILFTLTDEGLSLLATDNEITIKSSIVSSEIKEIIEKGEAVLPGRFVLDILRKLNSEDITIEEIDGGKIIISTPTSKYSLNCLNASEFPNIKIEFNNNPIKLTAGNFKEIVNQTVFATSTQESKPLLTGINLKIIGNSLESVATDSYRLAKKSVKFNDLIENSINIVIPARNINEFVKLLEDE